MAAPLILRAAEGLFQSTTRLELCLFSCQHGRKAKAAWTGQESRWSAPQEETRRRCGSRSISKATAKTGAVSYAFEESYCNTCAVSPCRASRRRITPYQDIRESDATDPSPAANTELPIRLSVICRQVRLHSGDGGIFWMSTLEIQELR